MSLKQPVIALAAAAVIGLVGSAPASAQESCQSLYARVMGAYQASPYSPEYAQLSGYYASRCLQGASAAPYQQPYGYQQQPPAYGYAQPGYDYPAPGYAYGPAPVVDPAGAIIGGAILGGVIAGAVESGDRRDRDGRGGGRR